MNRTIRQGSRTGAASAPASKSMAHRYLICAALSENESTIYCDTISDDIEATIDCLNALGADIKAEDGKRILVKPIDREAAKEAHLYCRQSGSTLRFLLPLTGVLGREAVFHMEGNLSNRPMTRFIYELIAHGMSIEDQGSTLRCRGKLFSGVYNIPGNISSQFISGLIMALPLMDSDTIIRINGELQSKGYVAMTEEAVSLSNIGFGKGKSSYLIYGDQKYSFPEEYTVEADWSGAAFLLCIGALSEKGTQVKGLKTDSSQGDRKILDVLREFGAEVTVGEDCVSVKKGTLSGITVDAADIPDLIPTICSVAALADGETRIVNAGRLRMKETDRIKSIVSMLSALGADIREEEDEILIRGQKTLKGGETRSFGDHRIAMAAAVAACGCEEEVILDDDECVSKSFPGFWEVFESLEV